MPYGLINFVRREEPQKFMRTQLAIGASQTSWMTKYIARQRAAKALYSCMANWAHAINYFALHTLSSMLEFLTQ